MKKICNKCYGYGEISPNGNMCSWCSGRGHFDYESHDTYDREEDIDLCPLCGCSPNLYDKLVKNYGLLLLDQDIKLIEDQIDLDLYERVLMTLVIIKETGNNNTINELITALRTFIEGEEMDSANQLTRLMQMKETIIEMMKDEETKETL